jgi:phospholipid/cholesterol/gamma-HCH transport system substrate-binding protein
MKKLLSANPAIVVVAVVALLVGAVLLILPGGDTKSITAFFPRTVSLYAGSDVKILGVTVGKVDEVTPMGTKVQVKFSYDAKYKLPNNVKAAVISPSIVGDRFVQMTPVYRGGKVLADNAILGLNRTATPLELDQIFGSITDLTQALGPQGANKPDASGTGALTRLIDSTAKNFGGEGVQFNQTLKNLAKFTKTLSDNKDQLFGSLAEIET